MALILYLKVARDRGSRPRNLDLERAGDPADLMGWVFY